MIRGLTPNLEKLLTFIEGYMAGRRVAPSHTEMQAHMGLASRSGINRMLLGLRDRGYLKMAGRRARGLTLLDQATKCFHCRHPAGSLECRAAARREAVAPIIYSQSVRDGAGQ